MLLHVCECDSSQSHLRITLSSCCCFPPVSLCIFINVRLSNWSLRALVNTGCSRDISQHIDKCPVSTFCVFALIFPAVMSLLIFSPCSDSFFKCVRQFATTNFHPASEFRLNSGLHWMICNEKKKSCELLPVSSLGPTVRFMQLHSNFVFFV